MKRVVLVLLILCSIHFWRYNIFPQSFFDFTDLLSLAITGISMVSLIQNKSLKFRASVILFLAGIVFNILSAYFNNSQPILDTFINFAPYYFIILYFFLHDYGFKRGEIETIIIVLAVLYSVFYLIQENAYPRRIFNGLMYRDRGTIRIRIEGNGFLMLGYFYLLNKYLLNRKLLNLILALFFFYILLKGGFRTLTAAAVLLSGVIFMRLVKYSVMNYALILLAIILFLGMLQMESTSNIINGMINASNENMAEGENYIRNLTMNFYSKSYPENLSYYIFGGGLPGGKSAYGSYIRHMQVEYGMYWVDLGLIGFYFVIGGITLLGLLWFTFKAMFTKLPPDALYLKIYFAYLLIVSFTTMEIFRPGIFAVEAIALYLIDISKVET